MKWQAKFNGRKSGSIGLVYDITDEATGDDEAAARLDLYNRFEHIAHLVLIPMAEDGKTMSLCQECVWRGIQVEHHESDLYIPLTEQTRDLVKKHGKKAEAFQNLVEGGTWLDIPFAYCPFWAAVSACGAALSVSGKE